MAARDAARRAGPARHRPAPAGNEARRRRRGRRRGCARELGVERGAGRPGGSARRRGKGPRVSPLLKMAWAAARPRGAAGKSRQRPPRPARGRSPAGSPRFPRSAAGASPAAVGGPCRSGGGPGASVGDLIPRCGAAGPHRGCLSPGSSGGCGPGPRGAGVAPCRERSQAARRAPTFPGPRPFAEGAAPGSSGKEVTDRCQPVPHTELVRSAVSAAPACNLSPGGDGTWLWLGVQPRVCWSLRSVLLKVGLFLGNGLKSQRS